MTLRPIAMRMPTADGIHAPSKLRPTIEMTDEKFIKLWADSAIALPVSFESDGVSDPEYITAYAYFGMGLDGWYIREAE